MFELLIINLKLKVNMVSHKDILILKKSVLYYSVCKRQLLVIILVFSLSDGVKVLAYRRSKHTFKKDKYRIKFKAIIIK